MVQSIFKRCFGLPHKRSSAEELLRILNDASAAARAYLAAKLAEEQTRGNRILYLRVRIMY